MSIKILSLIVQFLIIKRAAVVEAALAESNLHYRVAAQVL